MSVEAAGCRPIPAVEARRIVMATAAASWCAGVIPVLGLMMLAPPPARALAPGAQEAASIAVDAYIYFYPLVLMDFTRRQMTNVEPGKAPGRGPMNTFVHMRSYPSVDFKDVVRPNFDTLYSIAWLDLSEGPVVVSVPDLGDRYYLLPFLDMWSEVFACPGKRTTGTKAGSFALVPAGWKGTLPDGVEWIDAPTTYVWIIGRTQTQGPKDYAAVNQVQDGYAIVPLWAWNRKHVTPTVKIDPSTDMKTPPLDQVNALAGAKFFAHAMELMRSNSPHPTDWSFLVRMRRIGLRPGSGFDPGKADPVVREAVAQAPARALAAMKARLPALSKVVNGWQMSVETMGTYGNSYMKRAIVAMIGLGANQAEDAVYPIGVADADGKPLDGANRYLLHFRKEELPPVEAFWSVTMYDAAGFAVANPIDRYAIGDRDALRFNPDGSLDLYLQSASPGAEEESNWLPAPHSGALGVTMRLYAPRPEVLEGRWAPPPIRRVH